MNHYVAIYPWMMEELGDLSFKEAYVFANIWNFYNWKHTPMIINKATGIEHTASYLGLEPEELVETVDSLGRKGLINGQEDVKYYYLYTTEFNSEEPKQVSTLRFGKEN